MMIRVMALPRLPNRDKSTHILTIDQINYKILCIGDLQKVSIVTFSFE